MRGCAFRSWLLPFGCFVLSIIFAGTAHSQANPYHQLAHDIFQQLIEINTTDSAGNVTTAAEAVAQRFRDAGFPAADIEVIGPNDRKKNLVVRLHGTGAKKPILLNGHLDVVEARREDWTTDPFQFVDKNGFYYGRGTQDMKSDDAIFVTSSFASIKKVTSPTAISSSRSRLTRRAENLMAWTGC